MNPCGLHFLIGNKGACKSMLACKLSWKLLAETNRVIVTNLPVVWPGLEKYMLETYPLFDGRVRERVFVMEDIRLLSRFWLFRGFGWTVPDVTEADWARGKRLDFRYVYRWAETLVEVSDRVGVQDMTAKEIHGAWERGELERKLLSELPPVQYVIDEVQNVFPARKWQDVGPALLYYLTQQRKFGDDIIAISQRPGLMDKQLRELSDDWLFLTNWGRKQKGWFRMPSRATWAKYDQLPGPGVKPMVSGNFAVDVAGVGQTYDTSAGVGIEGGLNADKGARPPGAHWAWIFLVVAVVIAGVMQLPGGLTAAAGWVLGARTKPKGNEPQAAQPPGTAGLMGFVPVPVREVKTEATSKKPEAEKEKPRRLSGVLVTRGLARAFFADGEVVNSEQSAWEKGLFIDGRLQGARVRGVDYYVARE